MAALPTPSDYVRADCLLVMLDGAPDAGKPTIRLKRRSYKGVIPVAASSQMSPAMFSRACSARPSLGLRGPGVAAHHLARPPSGLRHQAALGAAGGEPAVGEGVPPGVRVGALDPGLLGAPLEDLAGCRCR